MTTIVAAAPAAAPHLLRPFVFPLHLLVPVAGVLEDIEREDDQDGYEDAEDAAFWSIIRGQEDRCPICEYWQCRCPIGAAPLPLPRVTAASGECAGCGGTFEDFNGGLCSTCRALCR